MIKESLENTVNFFIYLVGPEFWTSVSKVAFKILLIVVLAFIVIKIGNKIINHIFNKKFRTTLNLPENREETIRILLQSILKYSVNFIAIVMVLESMNIRISALLAGAGIAGLAIGFGAQNLVKDIISGFFIIFEKQFSIDDYVFVADVEGTVEEIGLRTTKIKSWTGELNVIPNGNISQVVNYSVHNGLSVVDVNVPHESDIETVENLINQILETIPNKYKFFVGKPVIHGVQNLEYSTYVIRIIADTAPVYQWAGERAIRKEVQDHLYQEGIYIPLQKFVVYSKDKFQNVTKDMM